MTTLCLNAASFAELFPPEPPTAPMPPEHVTVSPTAFHRAFEVRPPPPPPEAFESAPRREMPAHTRVKKAKEYRARVLPPVKFSAVDPRLPSNLAAHVFANDGQARRTPAQRRKLMAACPCRLCALALRPPLTFADAARFGFADAGFTNPRTALAAAKWEGRAKERVRRSCPACHGAAVVKDSTTGLDTGCTHPDCKALDFEGHPDPWKTDEAGPMDRQRRAEILRHNR